MRKRLHSVVIAAAATLMMLSSVMKADTPVITITLASLTVDQSKIGQRITLPITISNITGLNVTGYNFSLIYDRSVVEYTGYDDAGTISSSLSMKIDVNDSTHSRVGWAAAGDSPMTGGGTLINLMFKVKTTGSSPLTFTVIKVNDVIDPLYNIGKIKVGNLKPTMTAILPISATEKDSVQFTAVGTDPDNDSLSYTMTGAPVGAVLNAKTGKFVWVPPYGAKGSYTIAIKCTDVGGLNDVTNASITVAKKNVKPYLTAVAAKTVSEKDTLRFTIAAVDSNGDALIYSLTGKPVASTFDSTTGKFFWLPDTGTAGVYPLTVVVKDPDNATDTTRFTVTVTKKNFIPVIGKILAKSVVENDTLKFKVTGTDGYGEKITYSAATLPAGAKLDSVSGDFSWVPAVGTAGKYAIKFKACDPGGLFDTTTASITVVMKNQKPVLFSKTPSDTVKYLVAKSVTFKAVGKDPNNDTLRYTWKQNGTIVKPASTDSTYTTSFASVGIYSITAIFEDQGGLKDSTTWTVTIALTAVNKTDGAVPTEFALEQNYPNPFNPSTTISFSLPKAAPVTFEIYSILGTKIRTLMSGQVMSASYHNVVWDGKDDNGAHVSSGLYLYRINADNFTASKKMMLLK
jgi:hypothetical protein